MRPILYMSLALSLLVAGIDVARADQQQMAPGKGSQSAVVVNTGPDGICNTQAALGDIQAAPVGSGTPFVTEIKCGTDRIVSTVAAGNDTQLVAVGAACPSPNKAVVDTGPDGIADTTAAGDDTQAIAVGSAPSNSPCVITGGDGIAQTATASGDDKLLIAAGTAQPNTNVVLCGPNGIADTTANNRNPSSGDDVQLIPVGSSCTTNQAVVDSGANGIADTQAEGPDLVLKVLRPVTVNIAKGAQTASKTVLFMVQNVEFGASAPATRSYKVVTHNGSCPNGTVTQIDADSLTPGLQATASVPKGGTVRGSFVVTLHLEDITTVSTKIPSRCSVDVEADAVDTLPNEDDAANTENNHQTVDLEVFDKNDL
jgi:hypothetical protein